LRVMKQVYKEEIWTEEKENNSRRLAKTPQWRAAYNVLLTKYQKDQIKEGHVGEASSLHGRDGKCLQNFTPETSREGTIWSLGVSNALYVKVSEIVCM
jgi:hypothetical protein